MEEVKFVFKCLLVTVVLVVLAQIRVGNHTIEGHMMAWIHRSPISHTLQDVAEGAVKVGTKAKNAVTGAVDSVHTDDEAQASEAPSSGWFKIKRSAEYYRQKREREERARQNAENEEEDRD